LTANSSSGKLAFAVDSDLAGSSIHGGGTVSLAGDYPIDTKVSFSNIAWSRLRNIFQPATNSSAFEATLDGQVTVRGPITKVNELTGAVEIAHLNIEAAHADRNGLVLQNQDPLSATLEHGIVRIQNARIKGPEINLQAAGSFPLVDASSS